MLNFAKLTSLQFRPFDKADFMAFAGVESDNPLIAEEQIEDKYFTYIIDGDNLQVISGTMDECCESCVLYSLTNEGYF